MNYKHYIDLSMKSTAYLAELVVRGFSGYVLVTQFNNTIVLGAGLYLSITAALMLVGVAVKASKNAIDLNG